MIHYLLDRTINVHRLESVGGNKTAYQTATVSLEATIQQLSDTKGARNVGTNEKLFVVYLDVGFDFQEGDEVRDKDGNIYKIEGGGIEKRNDGFIADYLGLVVRKVN